MEILKEIEEVLANPDTSFFVGAAVAFAADGVFHFAVRIFELFSLLEKKEEVNENDVP